MDSVTEKSKKTGFFRGLTRTFFDFPRWLGVKQYVQTNKTLARNVRDTLRIAKPAREETFEAAMQRLHLNEQDLKNLVVTNQRGLILIVAFMVLLGLYALYLIFSGHIAAIFLILAVMVFSGVRAFQFSFWNFQIKQRQLGASFSSWWRFTKSSVLRDK